MKSGIKFQVLTLILIALLTLGIGLTEAFATLSSIQILPDDLSEGSQFGGAVAISEDYALIGAKYAGGAGAAFVFKKQGINWNQVNVDHDNNPVTTTIPLVLTASDGQTGDEFGCAIAFENKYAVIGAFRSDSGFNDSGAAYIFEKDDVHKSWVQIQKLMPEDQGANDYFGYSVAISGEKAAIGAYGKDGQAGAVYVFQKTDTGWEQLQKLTVLSSQGNDKFGWSIAMEKDTIVVGAPGYQNNTGRVYLFSWNASDQLWKQTSVLEATEKSVGDFFGSALDISGNEIIVGAYGKKDKSGTAIIFEKKNNAWVQVADLSDTVQPPETFESNDQFGTAVSISNDLAVVGSSRSRTDDMQTGAVFIFQRKDSSWHFLNKLTASEGKKDDRFGISVTVSDGFTLIGATGSDEAGADAGIGYLYINSVVTGASSSGDVNGDGPVDLQDLILTLKILSGIELSPGENIFPQGDVNEDEIIGLQEAIHILHSVADLQRGNIDISVNPSALYANGENEAKITVEATEINGNPMEGTNVVLSATKGEFENGSSQINLSLINGKAEARLITVPSDVSDTSTVTAVAAFLSDTADVEFLGVDLTNMTAAPESILANGNDESTIRIKLENADGTPLNGGNRKI